MRIRARPVFAALLMLTLASAVGAQIMQGRRGVGGRFARPLREGLPDVRSGFTFCRLFYTSVSREAGGERVTVAPRWRRISAAAGIAFALVSQTGAAQRASYERADLIRTCGWSIR